MSTAGNTHHTDTKPVDNARVITKEGAPNPACLGELRQVDPATLVIGVNTRQAAS